jgi:hypothetical protein
MEYDRMWAEKENCMYIVAYQAACYCTWYGIKNYIAVTEPTIIKPKTHTARNQFPTPFPSFKALARVSLS